MMRTDTLLHRTRIHFPRMDLERVKITPIEKGGSGRRFYRVQSSADQKLILVKYGNERAENRQYVKIARFLESHNVRTPKIYFHDAEEGLIWIEDLGEEDLFSYRHESWLVRRAFYESALDEAGKLHRIPVKESRLIGGKLSPRFNAALYLWEQNYFLKNCLGRHFRVEKPILQKLATLPALHQIAHDLDHLPRVLVHRDFQSQNILIRNGLAYLIDFQGMRPGLAQYDLASLLFDPYVDLSDAERRELTEHYLARQKEFGGTVPDDFERVLAQCAMQRLMQALGAYGFLGLVKRHKSFLQHIPTALQSLRQVVFRIGGLEELEAVLGRVIASPPGGRV